MAITNAEFDEINVGDYVIVAYVLDSGYWNDKPDGEARVIIENGLITQSADGTKWVNQKRIIDPSDVGSFATILVHKPKPKPKPKPAWVESSVIVVNDEFYLANGQGFTNAHGTKFSIEEIEDFGTVEVVA